MFFPLNSESVLIRFKFIFGTQFYRMQLKWVHGYNGFLYKIIGFGICHLMTISVNTPCYRGKPQIMANKLIYNIFFKFFEDFFPCLINKFPSVFISANFVNYFVIYFRWADGSGGNDIVIDYGTIFDGHFSVKKTLSWKSFTLDRL